VVNDGARKRVAVVFLEESMKPLFAALLALAASGCATRHTPPPAAAPPAVAATAPCNPALALVNGVLWTQSSAEHDAATLGIYASARQALDAALDDPSWIGSDEETVNDSAQPPAIVLDLDETAIDNTPNEVRAIRLGKTFDTPSWKQWVSEAAATAVPGAAEFLAYAKSRGVTPFYVTNRDADEEPGTRRTLEKLGYPLSDDPDNLLLRGKRPEWGSDKTSRRAYVAASYRVLLLLGDDLNDFVLARDQTLAERDAIVASHATWWGTRWFMLPNPMYGSWERAAGATGTPCEQLQKKVDALKP
jgi:acid phosphatase